MSKQTKITESAQEQDCQIDELTHDKIRKLFDYDSDTGVLRWKYVAIKNQVKQGSIAGWLTDCGYIRVTIDGVAHYAHRIIWVYVYGIFPIDHIDHINHIRNDNRICNLREVDRAGNSKNRTMNKNNQSGISGVGWHKRKKKWQARIGVNKKLVHLGSFDDISDAISAR